MAQFDSHSAECLVFTYKEGLLSSVAHDLKLRATDFQIELDETKREITARFNPASLQVVCAVKDGVDAPTSLSDKDRKDIEKNIQNEVLHTARFPEIRFRSTSVNAAGGETSIVGTLNLHGTERTVCVPIKREGDRWVADLKVNQPDYGVKPFRALFGALKVQPEVRVQLSVPAR